MSSIFPLREKVTLDDQREPRLVEIDEDTADEVFEALSSGTTRQIFLELHNAPQTASDLADVTETSVQNVQYHLEKLLDADLIDVVDTWYSERGSEMKVYAPQDESLVLFAGRDKQRSLRSLLSRVVGVLGVLVPASAFAGWAASRSGEGFGGLFGGSSDEGGADTTAGGDGGNGNGNGDATADGDGMADANGDNADGGDAAHRDTEDAADGGQENGGDEIGVSDSGDSGADAQETTSEIEQGEVTGFANDSDIEVATDGGETPDSVVDGAFDGAATAADGAASIDPALAAAVAFFVGGLFVFVALTMWYGLPDSWG
jgi:DNA-binding transcriptional ArsR family regulator